MKTIINGSEREIPERASISQLLDLFKLNSKSVVVEHNRRVIDRALYPSVQLAENDSLEIVHFVGGG